MHAQNGETLHQPADVLSVLLAKAGKRRGLAASRTRTQGKEVPGPCHPPQVSAQSLRTNKYSYLLLENSCLLYCPMALFQESSLTLRKYSMLQFSESFPTDCLLG